MLCALVCLFAVGIAAPPDPRRISCMAQPVLCSGVGQGSDYVEAEPWGAAFLPRRSGVSSPYPIPATRSEYPVLPRVPHMRNCLHVPTCKFREFPVVSRGVVDSRHVSICSSGIFLAAALCLLPSSYGVLLLVRTFSPSQWSATIATVFSLDATILTGQTVLALLVLLPTWQLSLRPTAAN